MSFKGGLLYVSGRVNVECKGTWLLSSKGKNIFLKELKLSILVAGFGICCSVATSCQVNNRKVLRDGWCILDFYCEVGDGISSFPIVRSNVVLLRPQLSHTLVNLVSKEHSCHQITGTRPILDTPTRMASSNPQAFCCHWADERTSFFTVTLV